MKRLYLRHYGLIPLVLGMWLTNNVQAHPHFWIDVFAEWQFNQTGMITGVKFRWLFDDYYSVLLVDDANSKGSDLNAVRNRILNNVRPHNYFLHIKQGRTKLQFGTPNQVQIAQHGHRVEIAFHLPLTKPVDPRRGGVMYQVAEPTYYFEMLHAEEPEAITLKGAPKECQHRLVAAQPDAALIAFASALGVSETSGNDLGLQFAETVTIQCD